MASELAFTVLVGVVAVQRLTELRRSRRNTRRLVARGGREHGAGHYPWMVVLHTAFLASCVAEVWIFERPLVSSLALSCGAVLVAATLLRAWAIRSLGTRWTTRVIVPPDDPPVRSGPYRWLDHPNYLAVTLEIAALPLLHTAWATAVLFSLLNGLLLSHRIGVEERALREMAS